MEIEEYLTRKSLEGCRENTITTYRDLLTSWQKEGLDYLARLSPSSRSLAVVAINGYLKACGKEPLGIKVKAPPLPERQHLRAEDIVRLLALPLTNNGLTGRKQRAFVLFLLDTGLRISEAVSLRLDQVDIQRGIVNVTNGKGGKARKSFLSPLTRAALVAYLRKRKDKNPNLWIHGDHQLSRNGAFVLVQRELARIGIEHGHPHMLRHTFAIQWIRKGGDLRNLQLILGHNDINITARYLQFIEEEQEEAHAKFSPLSAA